MTKAPLFIALAAVASLSACATNTQCNASSDYRNATSVEPIKGIGAISVPESPSALRIPPATRQEASAATPAPAKVNRRTSCLDFPPEMAAPAAK